MHYRDAAHEVGGSLLKDFPFYIVSNNSANELAAILIA